MGEEYMNLHINTYVSSFNKEVRVPSVHSIATNGWGADYGDPMNFLGQDRYERDGAYYAAYDTHINEVEETEATKAVLDLYREFTKMVEDADAITDLDARYEAFADAEAFMIEHCLVIPLNYGKGWALSRYDLSTRQNGIYGVCNEKMKNWATNANGYTTEEAAEWFK